MHSFQFRSVFLPTVTLCLSSHFVLIHSMHSYGSMVHESETWPERKENEVALQRAEMRMVRWMCSIKLRQICK